MKIFSEKHQELKDFEEVILDIEKELSPQRVRKKNITIEDTNIKMY